MLKDFFPYAAPVVTAAGAFILGWKSQRREDKKATGSLAKLELEWLERARQEAAELMELRVDGLIKERDRLGGQVGKLQERVAVLESHYKELEKSKRSAIAKLNRVIETLRGENEHLTNENAQLHAEMISLRERFNNP